MAKYRIPEQVRPGFELIAKLKATQAKAIKTAMKNSAVGSGPDGTIKSLQGKIDLNRPDLINVVETIFSILALYSNEEDTTPDEFLENIASAYEDSVADVKTSEKNKLIKNIKLFLDSDEQVSNSIKAATLLSENGKLFVESRVLSDIRLVFDDDLKKPSQTAVVIHRLKFEYLEGRRINEFYVSLEKKHLLKLKDTIDRAIEKDKLIRKNTYKDISFIETEE
ncbi:MAG: hypothetical protein COA97_06235 [Flavobacteriales bacterium]|nr:MAG: hypothetical protein COA97_06235 [Flavobacteriales bacterium]